MLYRDPWNSGAAGEGGRLSFQPQHHNVELLVK
jgi:hypothetical protein